MTEIEKKKIENPGLLPRKDLENPETKVIIPKTDQNWEVVDVIPNWESEGGYVPTVDEG